MRYIKLIFISLCLLACNFFNYAFEPEPEVPTPLPDDTEALIISAPPVDSITALPTPTLKAETAEEIGLGEITYWQDIPISKEPTPREGDFVIMDQIILRAVNGDADRTADPAVDIENSLRWLFNHTGFWNGSDAVVERVSVEDGLATVILTGEMRAPSHVMLIVGRAQILLTVFEEPTIDRAVVQLNGDSIGNVGISHSSEAVSADHVYTADDVHQLLESFN